MANLRTGVYGSYYGSFYTESEVLTAAEMQTNAKYIYSALIDKGWSKNAISALLGNLQAESAINPGRWQSDSVNSLTSGYGLVQWTPATKYLDWCESYGYIDPSEMDNNISRIIYELNNGIQWIATANYNLTFKEFSTSSESVEYLAKAFLLDYERPADQSESVQAFRASLASNWYTYLNLTGETPTEPDVPILRTKKKKFNFLLFSSRRRFFNG